MGQITMDVPPCIKHQFAVLDRIVVRIARIARTTSVRLTQRADLPPHPSPGTTDDGFQAIGQVS